MQAPQRAESVFLRKIITTRQEDIKMNNEQETIIEAAFLTGFEPSVENLAPEALLEEAQEYLINN